MSEPSCYKPKCKDCPVKDDCENFKPEIIYHHTTESTYTVSKDNPSGLR